MLRANKTFLSPEEYLRFEASSSTRHEYVNGQVFAMSGTTNWHNIIAGNVHSLLHSRLRGTGCRVYISDVKVHVKVTNSFYYPDVMVSCEPYDHRTAFVEQPVLIVEILSKSTASVDRREKVTAYRQIASLKEYLIISQRQHRIEMHRRGIDGQWEVFEYGANDELELTALPTGPIGIKTSQIYEDVAAADSAQVNEVVVEYSADDDATDW